MAWHVVIAGGGFGGFYAARTLEKVAAGAGRADHARQRRQLHALHAAAAGRGRRHARAAPRRRAAARGAARAPTCASGASARPTPREHRARDPDRSRATRSELSYDQLIVALGSVSRTLPVPGLAEHAQRLQDAARGDRAAQPRAARRWSRPRRWRTRPSRQAWLTYVFVGAGYAGLEGLAELQDFAADVIELYPRCRTQGMRWILVEAQRARDARGPAVAGGVRHARAARRAASRSARARRSRRSRETTARLSDGEVVPTRTVAWTAGVKPHPVIAQLGLPLDRGGRHPHRPHDARRGLRQRLGDRRRRRGARPARKRTSPSPPTAQHAIRQGRRVARNVAASLGTRQGHAVHATGRSACSSTWAAARPWPARSASGGAARRPGGWRAPTTWR